MKIVIVPLILSLFAASAFAVKPCDELKSEIAAKLDAKGVQGYQLDIVAAADVKDQQVIGTCEGGTKKLTYKKGAENPAPAAATPAKSPAPAKK